MPPLLAEKTSSLEKKPLLTEDGEINLDKEADAFQSKSEVKPHPSGYRLSFFRYFFFYHTLYVLGIYYFFVKVKWQTMIWVCFWTGLGSLGTTAGAHRLWSHKSYKATPVLRAMLIFMHAIGGTPDTVFNWARDHRNHHKYSDTDADPHNATRGLWYSHIGWLFLRKHPDVIKKGKLIYLDDLYNDRVLMFGHRYFTIIRFITDAVLPIAIPTYFWGEYWFYAWITTHFLAQVYVIHGGFTVNSLAHKYGMRPYDTSYLPSHNLVANVLSLGDAHHNYHHSFPSDYSHGEFNAFKLHPSLPSFPNLTTRFIEICAFFGLAYDLRRPSREMVLRRMARTGDQSLDHKKLQ